MGNMSTAAAPSPAKITRKPSLKEQPSYLKEVSVALSRREELLKLRQRMSAARLIMAAQQEYQQQLHQGGHPHHHQGQGHGGEQRGQRGLGEDEAINYGR